MTLPTSGPITLLDLQTEFGGTNPIGLNEYYRGGSFIAGTDFAPNVPSSGPIALSNFYSASKTTLQTVVFNSSTSWTVPSTFTGNLAVLVVGGGGSGSSSGGGGGSGGIAYHSNLGVSAGQTYTVTVGGGGARDSRTAVWANYTGDDSSTPPGTLNPAGFDEEGNPTYFQWQLIVYQGAGNGSSGTSSSFTGPAGTLTGNGGGSGGGVSGGSGGGGTAYNGAGGVATQGSGGTLSYGNAGGDGSGRGGTNESSGGGGGGCGAPGNTGTTSGLGFGGNGVTLLGYTVGGGGGSGGYRSLGGNPFPGSNTSGGTGGGGSSGLLAGDRYPSGVYDGQYSDSVSGTINTGGGGGGAQNGEVIFGQGAGTLAGSGGSGIVIIQGYW
jgi:hypothetical protein